MDDKTYTDRLESDGLLTGRERKFAVLIDGDNVSADYAEGILSEITRYGIATYKRIYGDWSSSQTAKWQKKLLDNSISPIQQFPNRKGKNATDFALVIDAMDILYTGGMDGFCIVSSDSDFTRLAQRLRESGMMVIGMGNKNTPPSFRNACSKYLYLENLMAYERGGIDGDADKGAEDETSGSAAQADIESYIIDVINEKGTGSIGLGELGSRIQNAYPDFDVRDYGYSNLSTFIEELPRFELRRDNNSIAVAISDSDASRREVASFVCDTLASQGHDGMAMSALGTQLSKAFPDFNVKDYGYSKLFKFIQSIDGVKVVENTPGVKRARIKRS